MKKVIAVLLVLVMCVGLTAPTFASEFVPSITYKDHPTVVIIPGGGGGRIIGGGGEVIEDLALEQIVIIPVAKTDDFDEKYPNE